MKPLRGKRVELKLVWWLKSSVLYMRVCRFLRTTSCVFYIGWLFIPYLNHDQQSAWVCCSWRYPLSLYGSMVFITSAAELMTSCAWRCKSYDAQVVTWFGFLLWLFWSHGFYNRAIVIASVYCANNLWFLCKLSTRPVLKHGPRSLTCTRVIGYYET